MTPEYAALSIYIGGFLFFLGYAFGIGVVDEDLSAYDAFTSTLANVTFAMCWPVVPLMWTIRSWMTKTVEPNENGD